MKFLVRLFRYVWLTCVTIPAADYILNRTNMPDIWTSLMYLIFLISFSVVVNTVE